MSARFTKPYVDAVFAVAGGADAVDALLPPLESFARLLAESAELRAALQNPAVDRARKNALIAALAARLEMSGLGLRLLGSLLSNRRIGSVGEVVAALGERVDVERRVVEARVTTARPLDPPAEERLASLLAARTKKTVRLVASVDPALLGGFVVSLGSEVYDASLARRLERAREALHSASTV